jgi:hypothetical protein
MVDTMFSGLPVIAIDLAVHSKVIADGVTGFLADAPTVSTMANTLERFGPEEMRRGTSER